MVAVTKNEEFSDRLNLLLDAAKAPPKNHGRARWFHDFINKKLKINVTYESTRKWLSGDAMPYTKRLGVIAKGLNSTTEYLIGESDEGSICSYYSEDDSLTNNLKVKEPDFFVSEYEFKFLQLFRQLPQEQQEFIRVAVKGLTDKNIRARSSNE